MLGRSLGPGCSHVEKALAGVQRAVLPGLDVGHDGVGEVALVSPVEEGVVDLSRIGSVLGGFEQGHVAERALQRHPQGDVADGLSENGRVALLRLQSPPLERVSAAVTGTPERRTMRYQLVSSDSVGCAW